MRAFVMTVLIVACAVSVLAQQLSSQSRAQTLAAAFTKQKHGTKEKHGVRTEKYKDVRSEPVFKQNIADYSGVFEVADLGFLINIQVGRDGRVQANGYEKSPQSRMFTLENAKIDGALLTASKVYQDGTSENFEAVFLNRTDRNSPSDPGVTRFGLGVLLAAPFEHNGLAYEKLFFQWKR